jgi:putative iron-only hydrogenase system regulator
MDFFLFEPVSKEGNMDKRVGFVGIIIEKRAQSAEPVNKILSTFGECVIVRTGVRDIRGHSVIMLVVDATTDQIGALTGKLGMLPGVSVKSAISKEMSAPGTAV